MPFLVTPSLASPERAETGEKGFLPFVKSTFDDWYGKFFSKQKKEGGVHKGPLRMPLLERNSILQSGKQVVYFGWLGKASRFCILKEDFDEDRNTWVEVVNKKVVTKHLMKVERSEFDFRAGKYLVKLTNNGCSATEKSHEFLLTVKDYGCLNELEKQYPDSKKLSRDQKAAQLSSQSHCTFEAYQQVAGGKEFRVIAEGLAAGKVLEKGE